MGAGPVTRRVVAGGAVALVAGLAACGSHPAAAPPPSSTPTGSPLASASASSPTSPSAAASTTTVAPAASPPELPRGGRTIFPANRLVGYAGAPGSTAFGRLGIGRIDDRVAEIEKLGRSYGGGRQVLPVLELIAVVAQHFPGEDGR